MNTISICRKAHYANGLTISECNGVLKAEWNETPFVHSDFSSDADGMQDDAAGSANA